ncbi:MAG: xylose isomerase [Flavobacteriaceae bacterium]|nr:xylose isomerase [Flavobacteriaceae bacterium]
MKRRNFLSVTLTAGIATSVLPSTNFIKFNSIQNLKISLAQWSLNKSIKTGKLPILDFAKKARSFGIEGIEFVSGLYTRDTDILERMSMNSLAKELIKRSDDYGIDNVLFMIDNQGDLASSKKNERLQAIDNHKKWIDLSAEIGCKTMRVNLNGEKDLNKWTKNSVKSLTALNKYNENINVVVENHGGLSSSGKYLSNVMSKVKLENCGTLPDFGNFCMNGSPWGNCTQMYDRYLGTEELMPYAHAVSAKSYDFDDQGNETSIDYKRMMDIVKKSGYQGYVGIEYEGNRLGEDDGIIATKKLLQKFI